jgi:hypothetical protein
MDNDSCIADIYKNTVFDLGETVQAYIYIYNIYIRLTFGLMLGAAKVNPVYGKVPVSRKLPSREK